MPVIDSDLGDAVKIYEKDENGLAFLGSCKGTPPSTANEFAKGAFFIDEDAGVAYINTGTPASPSWNSVNEAVNDDIDPAVIQVKKVSITNAQLKAMRATPVQLVPAQGADTLIQVESITLKLNAGANVLTESADNMVVQYSDSGQDITGAIESTGFIDQAADTFAVYYPAAIAAAAAATIGVNEKVELFNTGDGEFGGNAANDATLDVWISYRVLDFS